MYALLDSFSYRMPAIIQQILVGLAEKAETHGNKQLQHYSRCYLRDQPVFIELQLPIFAQHVRLHSQFLLRT